MEAWKIIFLSKWVICMFHVNLPGCTLRAPPPLTQRSSVSPPHPGLLKLGEQQWAILRRQQKEFLITCNERQPIKLSKKVSEFWRILFGMIYCWFWKGKKKSPFLPKSSELLVRLIKQNCMQTCDSWYLYILPVGVLVGNWMFVQPWMNLRSFFVMFECDAMEWIPMSDGPFFTSQDFHPEIACFVHRCWEATRFLIFSERCRGKIQQTDDASLVCFSPLEN